jgi:multidrug efflux pump subunit AcrA (membrane-fusion protein)
VKAERSGLVIYPSAAAWKNTPDIAEGATVRKDQVLLLMPDLSRMQVKVGIHESIVDRIKPGQAARITLPDKTLNGKVFSVASVTRPAGWWTGNVVKYDTIIKLPSVEGLKPGMSAEVEVIIDRHADVLTIPVAAVVETAQGDFCWVKTADRAKRRALQLGDTNDTFIVVKAGLKEGDEVVLDPMASITEAQTLVLKPLDKAKSREPINVEADRVD